MATFARSVALLILPIVIMIGLIPLVASDVVLGVIYLGITAGVLALSADKKEMVFFLFGFVLLTISEIFFVSTGVETFHRGMLLAGIPLWLPILWGFAFIMIRRGIVALDVFLQ